MIELDKKFIQKVLIEGGVEKDVFVKRYEKYIWGVINKRISVDGGIPGFVKNDIFQYIFIKLFEENGQSLKKYITDYSIPFQNYLSLFVASRITDFVRKEVKENAREVVLMSDDGENLAYDSAQNDGPGPVEAFETREFQVFLGRYAQGLTEKEQNIFRLMCDGSSSGEIAEELGYDIKQVYKIVFKLKNEFKATMLREAI